MTRQKPIVLIGLITYIFLPSFLDWVTDPAGTWYKPFVIWALVITGAVILQTRNHRNDI